MFKEEEIDIVSFVSLVACMLRSQLLLLKLELMYCVKNHWILPDKMTEMINICREKKVKLGAVYQRSNFRGGD